MASASRIALAVFWMRERTIQSRMLGMAIAAKMAKIATVTMASMRVTPLLRSRVYTATEERGAQVRARLQSVTMCAMIEAQLVNEPADG
ncbi:hypothetical protein A9O67_04580 [Tepidimonas fonticaldi]|uniref:Uncharacterized protein n=1 Tax=Tepidimonas fonticaldi TaxID=1101373 RepID=A0A1A6DU64_9BURK|nr:hypothetical protein A9O67_04580 [Tepidimonas fonticaldi]